MYSKWSCDLVYLIGQRSCDYFVYVIDLTGNPTVGFNEDDVEGDFDPDIHDEMMKKVFNSEYYQDEEEKKPEFSDSEEEGMRYDKFMNII